MKLTEFFLSEMDREVERSRRALEQVPEGKYDWKPHEKSMIFGHLMDMVATIPMWITMEIKQDELDVAPETDSRTKQAPKETSEALLQALDEAAGGAPRDDPGHDQPLGTSPWADDGLSAPDGRKGSVAVWTISG